MAGSHGKSSFSFLRNVHTDIHIGWTISCSHQKDFLYSTSSLAVAFGFPNDCCSDGNEVEYQFSCNLHFLC